MSTWENEKTLKQIQLKSLTDNLRKFAQDSLKFIAYIDKNVMEAISVDGCSDGIGCIKDVIQMTNGEWKSNSKLDQGKKWCRHFSSLKMKIFLLKTY